MSQFCQEQSATEHVHINTDTIGSLYRNYHHTVALVFSKE